MVYRSTEDAEEGVQQFQDLLEGLVYTYVLVWFSSVSKTNARSETDPF
jgi:hypothetical protein